MKAIEYIKSNSTLILIPKFLITLSLCVNVIIVFPMGTNAQSDFLKYINDENYDYRNVLILGVDAKTDRAKDLKNKYHYDLVIPISREGGPPIEDWARAAIEKLGIPTGSLEQLEEKNIENLFIHSWGSSRGINDIAMSGNIKVKNLHIMGSPHSTLFSSLGDSLDKGLIKKVYFHINEGDPITFFRHLPSSFFTEGKFTDRIEFHFYYTEQKNANTLQKKPLDIPIFNAPLGYDKFYHYNSPEKGHGLEAYFRNMSFVINRDTENSPFNKDIPPFFEVPSYWTIPSPDQPRSKNMTEARILTEMTHNKRKALIVGEGPEADLMYKNMLNKLGETNVKRISVYSDDKSLQFEARRFGADVILGVKESNLQEPFDKDKDKINTEQDKKEIATIPDRENKIGDRAGDKAGDKKFGGSPPPPSPPGGLVGGVGGVSIDPKPVKTGKGGAETKKKVLDSRPSENSPSWPVDIPEDIE